MDEEFPLIVWQTGSGTQTNMNVNEVISNSALLKGIKIHPNDDVNMSQSTNDVFPTALHIACAKLIKEKLIPSLENIITAFIKLEEDNKGVYKSGRTHLQDATPVAFSDEVKAWRIMLETSLEMIKSSLVFLYRIPIGGTAVGSGINTPHKYSETVVAEINKITNMEFSEDNKFHGLSSKDGLVFMHSALKTLAVNYNKIASDIRLLSSGPRTGFAEIIIPANEPGSSIMPGKVNPTQCEQATMVCSEIMGNDVTVSFASASGQLELNVYMPVIGFKCVESINLLSDSLESFNKNCVSGIVPDREKMNENLNKSLMLATAFSPVIGYDNCAKMVKFAHTNKITLKKAALELKLLNEEEFDRIYFQAIKY